MRLIISAAIAVSLVSASAFAALHPPQKNPTVAEQPRKQLFVRDRLQPNYVPVNIPHWRDSAHLPPLTRSSKTGLFPVYPEKANYIPAPPPPQRTYIPQFPKPPEKLTFKERGAHIDPVTQLEPYYVVAGWDRNRLSKQRR